MTDYKAPLDVESADAIVYNLRELEKVMRWNVETFPLSATFERTKWLSRAVTCKDAADLLARQSAQRCETCQHGKGYCDIRDAAIVNGYNYDQFGCSAYAPKEGK